MAEAKGRTETQLREAMRDARYWQAGHPERAVHVASVTRGFQELYGAEAEPTSKVVHVRGYHRTRNGHPEDVSDYDRSDTGANSRIVSAWRRPSSRRQRPYSLRRPPRPPFRQRSSRLWAALGQLRTAMFPGQGTGSSAIGTIPFPLRFELSTFRTKIEHASSATFVNNLPAPVLSWWVTAGVVIPWPRWPRRWARQVGQWICWSPSTRWDEVSPMSSSAGCDPALSSG